MSLQKAKMSSLKNKHLDEEAEREAEKLEKVDEKELEKVLKANKS